MIIPWHLPLCKLLQDRGQIIAMNTEQWPTAKPTNTDWERVQPEHIKCTETGRNVQKQEENRSYQSSSCLHKRDKIKWEPLPTNHWKENSFRTIKSEFIAEVSEDKDFAKLLAQCRCTRFQPLTRAAKPAWLNSQQSPLAAKGSEPKAQTYQYCNKDKNTVNKSFCKEWKQK